MAEIPLYQKVIITSVPTGRAVSFGPVIFNKFSDEVKSNFSNETVFGRTDPIYTFTSNDRSLQIGFTVPVVLEGDNAFESLKLLGSYIYPQYQNGSGRNTLVVKSSPLIKAKFGTFHSGELLGFLNSVRYEYLNPSSLGNFPINLAPATPRYLTVDLAMTVINTTTIQNSVTKVFG